MIRAFATWGRDDTKIPFGMFDLEQSANEARRAAKMRNIYHRGQDLAWDGRAILKELIAKHGGIKLSDDKRQALSKIFEIILWGELAAWKISAQLADELEPLEAKMAATSQAHDEARHFYVMYDYLKELGYTPTRIDPYSQKVLDITLNTPKLAHKILGMQLMIETIALTIFQEVRESRIEPVLSDLLLYFEKDEARHVGLGTQYLPSILKRMSPLEGAATIGFQMKLIFWTISSLKAMERNLAKIGITAPNLIRHGREKQMAAYSELWAGEKRPPVNDFLQKVMNGVEDAIFPGLERVVNFRTRLQIFKDGFSGALVRDEGSTPRTDAPAPAAAPAPPAP
jgi:hypothetical protein